MLYRQCDKCLKTISLTQKNFIKFEVIDDNYYLNWYSCNCGNTISDKVPNRDMFYCHKCDKPIYLNNDTFIKFTNEINYGDPNRLLIPDDSNMCKVLIQCLHCKEILTVTYMLRDHDYSKIIKQLL